MNMHFFSWSDNSSPELEEEDSARKFYLRRISKVHKQASISSVSQPEYSNINMLSTRYSLMVRMLFSYKRWDISEKDYKELAGMLNSEIPWEIQKRKRKKNTI